MTDALASFLRAQARRPMAWGASDCLLMGADWVLSRRGVDPAAAWRGAYADEASADDLLARLGGMGPAMAAALEVCGIRAATKALRGDVGLVEVEGPRGRAEACGIHTGTRWAVRAARGVWIGRATPLAVWRV